MATVTTSVTELPESRVRIDAEVPADEVERRLQHTARQIGRQMKLPGFRRGKVPPPMVLQRVGRSTVLDETVRDSLPAWYVDAIDDAGIMPVGDPQLNLADLPSEGQALRFSIEIGVRPPARLGEYRGLEVGRREPEVPAAAVERELEALRDRLARLETVDRPAAGGDFVVLDFTGTVDGQPLDGGEARDELVELGAGRLPEEMEQGLLGASAGERREIDVSFPADHGSPQLAGRTARFDVTVKEVKRKELPELDDDLAADAAGFDSLDELRDDLRSRLEEAERRAIDSEFREAAVDAAVAGARVDVPETLIDARARELWDRLVRTLGDQGVSREAYLQVSGKSEDELLSEARPDAERALRREAVLAAIVEAEGIEPSEEELLEALEHSAQHEQTTPGELLERLRRAGRLEPLRRDLSHRKAVDLVAGEARPIPVEQARARDKLWTPGKEEAAENTTEPAGPRAGELWTPGS
ncbi:MAG TPA: trigger factor [Solirubrobacteraceae bacterium]|nr:trigger factor [Solirubrobacteraceae bacterium]